MNLEEDYKQARDLREKGQFNESLEILERLLEHIQDNERSLKIKIINEVSQNLWRSGEIEKGKLYANKALELAQIPPIDINGKIYALNSVGYTYFIKGELDEAMKYFQESLTLAEQHDDPEATSYLLNNLGNIYYQRRDLEIAKKFYEKSLSIHRKLDNKKAIALVLNNLGNIATIHGNLKEANAIFNEGLEIALAENNYQLQALILNNLANVLYHQGNIEAALEKYEDSLTISQQINFLENISRCLKNIGRIFIEKGDHTKAEEYNIRGLQIAEQIGNPKSILTALINLGNINSRRGDFHKTNTFFERALILSEKLGNLEVKQSILHYMANNQSIAGNFEKAIEHYIQSLEIGKKVGNPLQIAETKLGLINLYLHLTQIEKAITEVEDLEKMKQNSEIPVISLICEIAEGLINFHKYNFIKSLKIAENVKIRASKIPVFDIVLEAIELIIYCHLRLYQITNQIEHKKRLVQELKDFKAISKKERLYHTYIVCMLIEGFIKKINLEFGDAFVKFKGAEELAIKCGINTLIQRAKKEIESLEKQLTNLNKLYRLSPYGFQIVQTDEILIYIKETKEITMTNKF